MTRIKDLLRESQENALTLNNNDLDDIFNMRIMAANPHLDDVAKLQAAKDTDSTATQYIQSIQELRAKQKKLLPLFLESSRIVERHQKCLKTILNENNENIPY